LKNSRFWEITAEDRVRSALRGRCGSRFGVLVDSTLPFPARSASQAAALSFLECRAFQTVEVAFPGGCLPKDMLRYFKRRDRLSDQEATIRDYFVQRLSHDGDRRGIVFLLQISHPRGTLKSRLQP
jgi:hypothetical protein